MIQSNLCINCYSEPIYIQKRRLGKKCYLRLRRQIKLSYGSWPSRYNKTFEQDLAERYGDDILVDLQIVKTKPYSTLTAIGEKYGFSREYARQIFNKLHGDFEPYRNNKTHEIAKVLNSIGCVNDPRYKVATFGDTGHQARGAKAELMVFEKCKQLGFKVGNSCTQTIDLIVNGYNVEVKSAWASRVTSESQKTPVYQYNASKKQRLLAHFIVCFHLSRGSFFIIPTSNITGSSIYIPEYKSTYKKTKDRYSEYENAWHLLSVPKNNQIYP